MFIVFVIGLGRIKHQQTVYFTAQLPGNHFQYNDPVITGVHERFACYTAS